MLDRERKRRLVTAVAALAILAVMGAVWRHDSQNFMRRPEDAPPVIDFTWTPVEPSDLRDLRGFLTIKDDYALDFTTYRMTIVELSKDWNLPIEGLMGREYEQPVSFGLIADKPEILAARQVTVRFSIADDKGHRTTIERIIKLK